MEKLLSVLQKLEDNLKSIDQLGEIGSDAGDLLLEMLHNLKEQNEGIPGFKPYKDRLDNTIGQIMVIKDHPLLKKKYSIIYNQSVVLVVASFESFMNDLVRDLIDFYPEVIEWPEKKQISFDPNILKYSSPSLGSLIVKSSLRERYNFQDIKSVLDFLKDYLNTNIRLEAQLKEALIKYEALRHVIIHNSAKIDERFKKQVRDMSYCSEFIIGESVELLEENYKEARLSYLTFANNIIHQIEERK